MRARTPNDDSDLKCPFCTCIFSSQRDLDLHLKAFGSVKHGRLVLCVAILSEVEGHNAGVDDHGSWRRGKRDRLFNPRTVKACRDLVEKSRLMRREQNNVRSS